MQKGNFSFTSFLIIVMHSAIWQKTDILCSVITKLLQQIITELTL